MFLGIQYFVGLFSNLMVICFYLKSNFVDCGVKFRVVVFFLQVLEILGNKYMVIGGGQGGLLVQIVIKNCEIYDVMIDCFVFGFLMVIEYLVHMVTKFLDGCILVVGGVDIQNNFQLVVEIWDLKINVWMKLLSMSSKWVGYDVVFLVDGCVWVSGGYVQNVIGGNFFLLIMSVVDMIEIYDLKINKWVVGFVMIVLRVGYWVILLFNGKYMIVGGFGWYWVLVKFLIVWMNCDFFDLKTNKIMVGFVMVGVWGIVLIVDFGGGKILVLGGVVIILLISFGKVINMVEIYDVVTNKWIMVGSMKQVCGMYFGFILGNGKYIHIGGGNGMVFKFLVIVIIEVFDVKTRIWFLGFLLGTSRVAYGYICMLEGQIYIIGGGIGFSVINVNILEWLY